MSPLADWTELEDERAWPTLLLGNGASMNIWSQFGYRSLYEVVDQLPSPRGLRPRDVRVFEQFDTTNFEQVLGSLLIATTVGAGLGFRGREMARMARSYERVRRALADAVREKHVEWLTLNDAGVLASVRETLTDYRHVFTTNYDLILYWSLMTENGRGFTDFFFASDEDGDVEFDIANTDVWQDRRPVYYLHGGLHLYRSADGGTKKRSRTTLSNLLSRFDSARTAGSVPLIVSEGRSREKLRAIRRSDYLTFCFERLSTVSGNVVIFGHSLSRYDAHIVAALRVASDRAGDGPARMRIAVSMCPGGSDVAIDARRATLQAKFPQARVTLFDATTHPLGDSALTQG